MQEIWKTIEEAPNYEVSTEGNIRNKTSCNYLNRNLSVQLDTNS